MKERKAENFRLGLYVECTTKIEKQRKIEMIGFSNYAVGHVFMYTLFMFSSSAY